MKKLLLFTSLINALLIFSCKKDSNPGSDNNNSITVANVNSALSTGNWRVSYYWDTDHEETNNYTGYIFSFVTVNGVIVSKPGFPTISGSWSLRMDDNKIKLSLVFPQPTLIVLDEIGKEWHVIERTDIKIKLQDVSSGGTDLLTFERN